MIIKNTAMVVAATVKVFTTLLMLDNTFLQTAHKHTAFLLLTLCYRVLHIWNWYKPKQLKCSQKVLENVGFASCSFTANHSWFYKISHFPKSSIIEVGFTFGFKVCCKPQSYNYYQSGQAHHAKDDCDQLPLWVPFYLLIYAIVMKSCLGV